METESLKSERSGRSHNHSHKSKNSGRSRNHFRQSSNNKNTANSLKNQMAPFQTTVNLINDDERESHGQEVIEVQILPQDENWGGETHITGNTSEQSISMENINWPATEENFSLKRHCENSFLLLLCCISFLSPIGMALLPKLGFFSATFNNEELNQLARIQLLDCNAECKGLLNFK